MRKIVGLLFLFLLLGGWNVHGKWTLTNGLTEGQSAAPCQTSMDDGFINEAKCMQAWTYVDNTSHPAPNELDVNGYPLYGANAFSHGGVYSVFFGPSQTERPGNHVVLWGGAGTIHAYEYAGGGAVANVSCQYSSNGGELTLGTYSSGTCSNTACTGTCTGQWVFSVSGESRNTFIEWGLGITAVKSGNTVQNLAFLHVNDQTAFGWTMANWPGPNAISSNPHVSNTGQIGGVLFEQRVAQGGFGVWRWMDWMNSATYVGMCTTWSTRKPTSYAYYNGQEMRPSAYVGNPSYNLNGSSNDYAATLGTGPPVNKQIIIAGWLDTATNGTITFNLNGTGALPVYTYYGLPIPNGSTYYFPTAGYYGSLIFDSELNGGAGAWMSFTGSTFDNTNGINCGIPPEIAVQLSIEMHVHPWFDAYTFTLVPLTDFYPSLAAYIQATAPSWMVTFYTAGNEPFNNGTYAGTKADLYWGVLNDSLDWFCMGASLLGQALNTAYGGNTSKYEFMVEPQTVTAASSSNNPLITCPNYVAYGPAQVGFTQDPAYKWLTAIAINNYWTPVEVGTQQEVVDAYNYSVGSAGQQATILAKYVNSTLGYGKFGITNWNALFAPWYTWGTGCAGNATNCNIKNMYFYEGGYVVGNNLASVDATIAISSATNTNPAILTTGLSKTVSVATNAASAVLTLSGTSPTTTGLVIGSTIGIEGASGGTWSTVDDQPYIVTATTATTITINLDSTLLGTFASGTLSYNGAVVGMTVDLSAAVGGTWSSVVGNSYTVSVVTPSKITLGGTSTLDSTLLGTLSSATLDYTGSTTYLEAMQEASYAAPAVGTLTTANYNAVIAAGGKYPSMFYLAGTLPGSPWTVWSPDIYGATSSASDPGPPQWRCIQKFNNVPGISCP